MPPMKKLFENPVFSLSREVARSVHESLLGPSEDPRDSLTNSSDIYPFLDVM